MDDHIIKPSKNMHNLQTQSLVSLLKNPNLQAENKEKNQITDREHLIFREKRKKYNVLPIISSFVKFETSVVPNPIISLKKPKGKKVEAMKYTEFKDSPYNEKKDIKSHALLNRIAEINKRNMQVRILLSLKKFY